MNKAINAGELLPWPSEWSTPRPRIWTVLADGFLGILTLGFLGVSALSISSGELGSAAFFLAAGLLTGAITILAMSMWRLRRRVSPRSVALRVTGSNYDGVTILYSTRRHYGLIAILLMTFVLSSAYAIGGILDWGTPPFTSTSDTISVALFGTFALFCLWLSIEFVSGRVAKGRLVLTPDGVYHRNHTFEHFAPWYTVVKVSAVEFGPDPFIVLEALPSNDTWVRRTWIGKQAEFNRLPDLVVRGRSLAVDPAVAYHALRYYHAHPEARAELVTPAGEWRIRSGNLLG